MSDRAMVLVPMSGNKKTMVEVQNRHVSDVPGPGDEEVVFDTTLNPEVYQDNVTVAAMLARLITKGRHYEMVRESICATLGELEDIIVDLKDDNVSMTESSRLALHIYVLDRLHDIGKMVHFDMDMVPSEHKENKDGNNE